MVRKIIFWSHLVAGVVAGLVILMMSFTGVLITYEYQMIENADMKALSSENTAGEALALEEIMTRASVALDKDISGAVIRNVPGAPYQVSYDRRGATYVDPYTGELLGSGDQGIRSVLAPIRSWHRWFNVNGDGRDTARAITGASNVMFLFILISGIYLWLPKMWRAAAFKSRLWFKKSPTSKARDYNWHHVFGFWSLIPLIAIVATATGFSYPGVRDFVNNVTAESESQETVPNQEVTVAEPFAGTELLSLDALVAATKNELGGKWYKISVAPLRNATSPARMTISLEKSMAPSKQETWSLDPYTGEVLGKSGWDEMTTQAKANQVIRRLHTGEFYGIVGQTIAGLVSAFACIMVWTGIALAWRRLISPLLAKSKAAS